jgi:hypothetical protein
VWAARGAERQGVAAPTFRRLSREFPGRPACELAQGCGLRTVRNRQPDQRLAGTLRRRRADHTRLRCRPSAGIFPAFSGGRKPGPAAPATGRAAQRAHRVETCGMWRGRRPLHPVIGSFAELPAGMRSAVRPYQTSPARNRAGKSQSRSWKVAAPGRPASSRPRPSRTEPVMTICPSREV